MFLLLFIEYFIQIDVVETEMGFNFRRSIE